MDHQNASKLPVINLSKENLKHSTCKQVRNALEEYGCFIAVYDKTPLIFLELRDSIFFIADQLFQLPLETKAKNTSKTPFFGYLGDLQGVVQLYESLGIEDATSLQQIKSFCELMWPDRNEEFCEIIHQYANLLAELEKMVVRMVFEGYGLKELCESHINSTTFLLRLNSYRVRQPKEKIIGATAHTDKSFLTILDQDQVNGLEVKLKDQQWHAVDFLPSSFVVMAGEALRAWSNNRIQSPVHQVTMNGKNISRFSIGIFSYHNGIIHIPTEMIDEEQFPRRFKSFDHLGFVAFFANDFKLGRNSNCSIVSYCGV
ncbi:OLC1v1038600C1 [Oldenlandia corymbosa var. corymbosa]|uniref:OLC1v1038600C1 n=1 Tax=Oldenlandia corymbosa var. corymbosa TaxID=529605 RepID=A0AAV1D3X5_OLDCO|nr:OLC1v1038600C1 [Oldenlandia corymbosa var. corymbosa]